MYIRDFQVVCRSAGGCTAILAILVGGGRAADIEQGRVREKSLIGARDGNQYLDAQLSATLRQDRGSVSVPGFAHAVRVCIITLQDRAQVAGERLLKYRALSKDDPVVLDEDRYGNDIAGEKIVIAD